MALDQRDARSSRLIATNSNRCVPPGIVEALIAGLDGSDLVTFNGGLMLGQTVRIIAGPFAGGLGVLQRLDARGRVRLLLEIMGGQAPVVIDRAI